jgi:hypothetical protein
MAHTRKTYDEWQIQGLYSGQWEEVCSEDNRKDAQQRLKEYRENESGTPFQIKKVRIKSNPQA